MRWLAALVMAAACGHSGFAVISDAISVDGPLTYRDVVLADSPAGYWRLGDLSSVAKDETGTADGTYSGSCIHGQPGALAGDSDGATQFDGATCRVQLADHYMHVGSAPFTIELWVSEAEVGVYQHLFTSETRSGSGPIDGFALLTSNVGLRFERVNAATTVDINAANVPVGAFTYLVATYNGISLELFVDGSSVMSVLDQQAIEAYDIAAFIGAAGPVQTDDPFDGVLDEVAIYDHVLAPDRIMTHRAIALGQ